MNSTIYIFGDFGNGHTQYPSDYTNEIFLQFQKHTQAPTQLTIRRDDNMMYYGYVRKLHSSEQYIGICIVLNGCMFRGIETLFNRFENYITDIVVRGQIIEFSNDGNLISNVTKLYECQNEIERIAKFIQNDIETLGTQKLPPTNLSIGKNESKSFVIDDNAESILEATYNYGYTYVYKDVGYNTNSLSSYAEKLNKLNNEKTDALKIIDKQKQEISDLKKKQKNYKLVILLILIICVGAVTCFIYIRNRDAEVQQLNKNIEEKILTIDKQNQRIEDNIVTIRAKEILINNLQSDKKKLFITRDSLYRIISSLKEEKKQLKEDKKKITKKLSQTEIALSSSKKEINSLKTDNDNLVKENKTLRNNKFEIEKYKVYAKRGKKAYCYYKNGNLYYKTDDSYSDNTIVDVYYKNTTYALTEKGYVKLGDLRKLR